MTETAFSAADWGSKRCEAAIDSYYHKAMKRDDLRERVVGFFRGLGAFWFKTARRRPVEVVFGLGSFYEKM